MTTPRPAILDELEADATADAGAMFVRLVADYFASTRRAEGGGFPAHTPESLAARFDEPLPRDGSTLHEVVERLARDVVPDAHRLFHPMYVGHQVSAPLPIAVWTDIVTSALNQSVAVWEMSPVGTV